MYKLNTVTVLGYYFIVCAINTVCTTLDNSVRLPRVEEACRAGGMGSARRRDLCSKCGQVLSNEVEYMNTLSKYDRTLRTFSG